MEHIHVPRPGSGTVTEVSSTAGRVQTGRRLKLYMYIGYLGIWSNDGECGEVLEVWYDVGIGALHHTIKGGGESIGRVGVLGR